MFVKHNTYVMALFQKSFGNDLPNNYTNINYDLQVEIVYSGIIHREIFHLHSNLSFRTLLKQKRFSIDAQCKFITPICFKAR